MRLLFYSLLLTGFTVSCSDTGNENNIEWSFPGGDPERTQYSSLREIDTTNVQELEVLWTYQTGDAVEGSQLQCNPIIVDGILYATSPGLKLFALDALTGEQKWVFDASSLNIEGSRGMNVNRGVTFWTDGVNERIFYVVGSWLISVDAQTGDADTEFGDRGFVDLRQGLDRDVSSLFVTSTSPGVIYEDLLILGSRVSESNPSAPGHIRAFDVKTGAIKWIFHTIPHPGETGYETWEDSLAYTRVGGANSWSGLSLDRDRGLVFASTGSAAFDFYGGDRKGDNLFANCILALDAGSGDYKWHFQTVHHDVWDRDLPAPAILSEIVKDGVTRDAVIQATKTGVIFVLDRDTGEPVFPVKEIPVPYTSGLQGEQLSSTQPIPEFPEPFMRHELSWNKLRGIIPDSSYAELMNRIESYSFGHLYTPPSENGTIFFPGLDGGAEWGGASFDAGNQVLYINANEVPWIITNVKKTIGNLEEGVTIYSEYCMSCHGPDLEGAGNYPGLIGIKNRLRAGTIQDLLNTGKGMMPSFAFLSDPQRTSVVEYILNYDETKKTDGRENEIFGGYTITGYDKLQTAEGIPAIDPPWGTLNAVSLESGQVLWKTPLGEHPKIDQATGTENYGGPVATDGGLVFIAATPDSKFRAFRKSDGEVLWEVDLPAPAFATPAVYNVGGKQIVVVACGGGKLNTPSADFYIAFSLPSS